MECQLSVSSGYRSAELCKAIGSSSTSQHTRGEAADFEIFGIANKTLAEFIVANLDFDQCILEFWNENEPNSGWVHCSFSKKYNRKQYLKAEKVDGKIVYLPMF
jgi:zinc D-Ala-D-Ala carboxypeptidase